MTITFNGKPMTEAISATIIEQIHQANPSIDIQAYAGRPDELPGYKEAMSQPRYLSFSQADEKTYKELKQKIWRSGRLHKHMKLDCRRTPDGHQSVAAMAGNRTLWEMDIAWDILIDRAPSSGDLAK